MEDLQDLTSDGGLKKKIVTAGTGGVPKKGSNVKVHYVGKFENGKVFDQSDKSSAFEFTLGQGQVIKGWDVGVATMKKGESCTLWLRSDYAYGTSGAGKVIPPNTNLVFDVTLL
jgi:FKBP-type peptidyl-prolyl cis-trans isomerase